MLVAPLAPAEKERERRSDAERMTAIQRQAFNLSENDVCAGSRHLVNTPANVSSNCRIFSSACWCFLSLPKKALTRPECEGEAALRKNRSIFSQQQIFHTVPVPQLISNPRHGLKLESFSFLAYSCHSITRLPVVD